MTVLFRCRIKKPLLDKAGRVAGKLGTTTPEMVRMFLAQIARTGKAPLDLNTNQEESATEPWELRAATLESFYDKSKTW
ncbi:MAG TPA: type II toxin-antitoxin system RelB/DinJ family antitoxin [Verrucomicrobiae bacterium]|nr:type II toxin-antitoxin system RelB/DinJ family antitoxin [Verrucomicrobiae bacterium]